MRVMRNHESTVLMPNGDLLPVEVFDSLPNAYEAERKSTRHYSAPIYDPPPVHALQGEAMPSRRMSRVARFRLQTAIAGDNSYVFYWEYLETSGHVFKVGPDPFSQRRVV